MAGPKYIQNREQKQKRKQAAAPNQSRVSGSSQPSYALPLDSSLRPQSVDTPPQGVRRNDGQARTGVLPAPNQPLQPPASRPGPLAPSRFAAGGNDPASYRQRKLDEAHQRLQSALAANRREAPLGAVPPEVNGGPSEPLTPLLGQQQREGEIAGGEQMAKWLMEQVPAGHTVARPGIRSERVAEPAVAGAERSPFGLTEAANDRLEAMAGGNNTLFTNPTGTAAAPQPPQVSPTLQESLRQPYGYSPMPGIVTRGGSTNVVGQPTDLGPHDPIMAAMAAKAARGKARAASMAATDDWAPSIGRKRTYAPGRGFVTAASPFVQDDVDPSAPSRAALASLMPSVDPNARAETEGGDGIQFVSNQTAVPDFGGDPGKFQQYRDRLAGRRQAARDLRTQRAMAAKELRDAQSGRGAIRNEDGSVDLLGSLAAQAGAQGPGYGGGYYMDRARHRMGIDTLRPYGGRAGGTDPRNAAMMALLGREQAAGTSDMDQAKIKQIESEVGLNDARAEAAKQAMENPNQLSNDHLMTIADPAMGFPPQMQQSAQQEIASRTSLGGQPSQTGQGMANVKFNHDTTAAEVGQWSGEDMASWTASETQEWYEKRKGSLPAEDRRKIESLIAAKKQLNPDEGGGFWSTIGGWLNPSRATVNPGISPTGGGGGF